ncbi:MAG: cytochrome c biogenesis protein CcsA [Phycisphaerae bacterium]|nr:cytochrome c biogenesis protein CcsA [Phycisphaerae bacterium]
MIEIPVSQLFCVVLATVVLSVATTGATLRVRYQEKGVGKVVPSLTALAVALNIAALLWRALDVSDARHILANRFDVNLLFATLVIAVSFHSQLRPAIRGLDTFLLPIALFVQVFSFLSIRKPQLPGNIHSWFVLHQVSFTIGMTLLMCGGVAGGAYLLLNRVLRSKRPSSLLWRLAPLESWERWGRWSLLLGFLCITFGMLTGICQASRSSSTTSRDWFADKFIIGCIVVWILYAVGIVASWVVPRFRGRRSAILAVAGGVVLVVVFLVVEQLSGVHR